MARSSNNSTAKSLQLQRSWRTQPPLLDGRLLLEQALDPLVGRLIDQRFRASPPAVEEGRLLVPDEASHYRLDGGARALQDPSGLGGRTTVGGEQHYVHPKPPARLTFALHFSDRVLAFGRSDGDTLHGRPFLWWLDGFGVFTMPQRTAVCSIILGIYLVVAASRQ
jgi:hypothetical protein